MSRTPPPAEPPEKAGKPAPKRRLPLGLRIAAWALGAVVAVVALVVLAAVGIDTDAGHRLLAQAARNAAMANGLKIGVGRIDGSIYRRMTIRDLTLSDPRGAFLASPAVTLDWRPMELLHKHVLVEELSADSVHVLRAPALKAGPPSRPNQPALPDVYATVNRLHLGALVLEPALTGDRRSLFIDGSMQLLHGSARIELAAQAQGIDGHAGGDRLTVKLDAAPDQNRLAVDAHLAAPRGGGGRPAGQAERRPGLRPRRPWRLARLGRPCPHGAGRPVPARRRPERARRPVRRQGPGQPGGDPQGAARRPDRAGAGFRPLRQAAGPATRRQGPP